MSKSKSREGAFCSSILTHDTPELNVLRFFRPHSFSSAQFLVRIPNMHVLRRSNNVVITLAHVSFQSSQCTIRADPVIIVVFVRGNVAWVSARTARAEFQLGCDL